jgi:hypothetical protein
VLVVAAAQQAARADLRPSFVIQSVATSVVLAPGADALRRGGGSPARTSSTNGSMVNSCASSRASVQPSCGDRTSGAAGEDVAGRGGGEACGEYDAADGVRETMPHWHCGAAKGMIQSTQDGRAPLRAAR